LVGILQRFAALEASIAEEKGSFALFALFMRKEVPDRWDLIVSAPWLGDDKVKRAFIITSKRPPVATVK
jgi:hypothetical protein